MKLAWTEAAAADLVWSVLTGSLVVQRSQLTQPLSQAETVQASEDDWHQQGPRWWAAGRR